MERVQMTTMNDFSQGLEVICTNVYRIAEVEYSDNLSVATECQIDPRHSQFTEWALCQHESSESISSEDTEIQEQRFNPYCAEIYDIEVEKLNLNGTEEVLSRLSPMESVGMTTINDFFRAVEVLFTNEYRMNHVETICHDTHCQGASYNPQETEWDLRPYESNRIEQLIISNGTEDKYSPSKENICISQSNQCLVEAILELNSQLPMGWKRDLNAYTVTPLCEEDEGRLYLLSNTPELHKEFAPINSTVVTPSGLDKPLERDSRKKRKSLDTMNAVTPSRQNKYRRRSAHLKGEQCACMSEYFLPRDGKREAKRCIESGEGKENQNPRSLFLRSDSKILQSPRTETVTAYETPVLKSLLKRFSSYSTSGKCFGTLEKKVSFSETDEEIIFRRLSGSTKVIDSLSVTSKSQIYRDTERYFPIERDPFEEQPDLVFDESSKMARRLLASPRKRTIFGQLAYSPYNASFGLTLSSAFTASIPSSSSSSGTSCEVVPFKCYHPCDREFNNRADSIALSSSGYALDSNEDWMFRADCSIEEPSSHIGNQINAALRDIVLSPTIVVGLSDNRHSHKEEETTDAELDMEVEEEDDLFKDLGPE